MHITFWEILIYYFISFSLGIIVQVYLSYRKRRIFGKILPLSIMSIDFYLSTANFNQAFTPGFDYLIFIASLIIFVFLAVPAFLFFFIDMTIKRKIKARKKKTKQKRPQKVSYKRRP